MPTISSSSPLRTIMRSLRSLNISTIFKYIEKHTIGVLRNKYKSHIAIKVLEQIYKEYSAYYLGRDYVNTNTHRISVQHKDRSVCTMDIRDYNYILTQFNRIVSSYYMSIDINIKIPIYEPSILAAYILHSRGHIIVENRALSLFVYLHENGAYDLIFEDSKDIKKKRKMFNKC